MSTTTHRGRDQHLQPQALYPQPAGPRKARDYWCRRITFLQRQQSRDLSSIQGKWKMLGSIIGTRTFGENNSNLLLRPKNFLNSFNEQTPQMRLCSIPITSIVRMIAGTPRAPKAAAGSAVLHSNMSTSRETEISTDAFWRALARSSSRNRPSAWRWKPPKVHFVGSWFVDTSFSAAFTRSLGVRVSMSTSPKAERKSCFVQFSSLTLVVECQRYKQLNYGPSLLFINISKCCQTHLATNNVTLSTLK